MFIHGTADSVAEPEDTEAFCKKLKELGHSAELIWAEGETHVFMLFDFKASDEYATEWAKKYIIM